MDMEERDRREEKRGIFLGIIGVLTLIVAIIGASFAYFSINARSQENAVNVKAATVQIIFEDGDKINLTDIIPATQDVASWAFENHGCLDANNKVVCASYDFGLVNTGDTIGDLQFSILPDNSIFNTEEEETPEESETPEEVVVPHHFENLKYLLYDITDEENITLVGEEVEGYKLSDWNTETFTYNDVKLSKKLDFTNANTVENGEEKKYRLFIWLDEINDQQDIEQGAQFSGTIYIDLGEDGRVTGKKGE